jgi:DNA polymerase III alpha subunit
MSAFSNNNIKDIMGNNPHKKHYFCQHCHTNKSTRDGVAPVKDIIKTVKERGFKRYIPTDHGNIASMFDVFKECEKNNIQAGIGCEFYLTLSNNLNERKTYHITTMVKDDEGYKNMLKLQYLSNIKEDEGELDGFTGAFYFKSRITEKVLFHYQKGLIVTSGCRLSIFNQLFIEGKHEEAKALLDMFSKNIDNFFIELHVANNEVEEELFHYLKKYAEKNNLPTIIANDAHYLEKDDLISWNLLGASRHNNDIYNDEHIIKNKDFHIKTYEEIWEDAYRCNSKSYAYDNFITINKSYTESFNHFFNNYSVDKELYNIQKKIDHQLDMMSEVGECPYSEDDDILGYDPFNIYEIIANDTNNLFNGFTKLNDLITFNWYDNWDNRKLPMLEFDGAEEAIRAKINEGLKEQFGSYKNIPKTYIDRIKKELEIGKATNNISYFYFVMDFMQDCMKAGIMGSGGRGSAGSLLIGKYLGFHTIDALKYDFIIERAMNPDRIKLMDIDLDFASSERHKAVEILEKKYGKDHVVAIINYGVNGIKQSIQTVGRFLKIRPEIMDNLSKEITQIAKDRVKHATDDEEIENRIILDDIRQTSFYKEFYMDITTTSGKNVVLNSEDFIDYVRRVVGTVNNTSVHASGILVMNKPVYEYIPVTRVGGILCSSYDMKVLEELNGLKIDILSVSVYDIIKDGLGYLYDNNMLR